ncbi:MAG: hypothetical protein CYPHOPRED_003181 [Cyphobasidiales sp. Tagirdzhanova-0007]|nr:MAG: hypothetical protein CYPHOPRED_003181 [Cyphobasidiales sp. Tagirdzhanova-0007]
MTTFEYIGMNAGYHGYDGQPSDGYASYASSPGCLNQASPSIGGQEYSQLLEAFTHSSFGDDAGSNPPLLYDHTIAYQHARPDVPVYAHDTLSPSSSFSGTGLQFAQGLRIHPAHYQVPQLPLTEQPNFSTVANLEEAAAAASRLPAYQPHALQHASIPHSRTPKPRSRRSTLDGAPHIASLTLSASNKSISTASTTSSSQNSPKTPLSAQGYEYSPAFQQQQQHYLSQNVYLPSKLNHSSASVPLAVEQEHAAHSHHRFPDMNPEHAHPPPSSVPLSQSQSRLSSAGLMDQVVSSRRALASPVEAGVERMQSFGDLYDTTTTTSAADEAKSIGSRISRSRSLTSTPPSTPARIGTLRSSRGAAIGLPASVAQAEDYSLQSPSSAGPHRTSSRRMQAMQSSFDTQGGSPGGASTALGRPTTLRRSTSEYSSHTPKGPREREAATSMGAGLDLTLPELPRQHDPAHTTQPGSMHPLHMTHIGGAGAGMVPEHAAVTAAAAGMTRAQSSPGYTSTLPRPASSADLSNTTSSSNNNSSFPAPSRRSTALSALQMSPLPPPSAQTATQMAALPPVSVSVSVPEALLALDQLSAFLSSQATLLYSNPKQPAHLALGTQEQCHTIDNIRRRIQLRLSSGLMSLSSASHVQEP